VIEGITGTPAEGAEPIHLGLIDRVAIADARTLDIGFETENEVPALDIMNSGTVSERAPSTIIARPA
jgi:hypothetical protein